MGFVQFLPSTWRTEAAAAPGAPRDPDRSLDALTVAASYLHRIEVGAVGGGQHDLHGALAMYGGNTAYADQGLAVAAPAITTSSLPVVLPIPAPGWVKRIPTPAWPADLAAHMSPSGVINQSAAGGVFGHIATVVAVGPDRYEVIVFVDVRPDLEPHWQTFDMRSVAWSDPAVVGFVVAPAYPPLHSIV